MPVRHDSGYLAKIEASHLVIQPMSGIVIIKLKCYVPSERAFHIMSVETSLSEATAICPGRQCRSAVI